MIIATETAATESPDWTEADIGFGDKIEDDQRRAMINAIADHANQAAIIENKHFDFADTFFSLAFMPEASLREICRKIGIID